MPKKKSIFWSLARLLPFRRNAGQNLTATRPYELDEADTQPLPLIPVQPSYSQDTGRYRPRRARNDRWGRNQGARRRVGRGVDSRVAL